MGKTNFLKFIVELNKIRNGKQLITWASELDQNDTLNYKK